MMISNDRAYQGLDTVNYPGVASGNNEAKPDVKTATFSTISL